MFTAVLKHQHYFTSVKDLEGRHCSTPFRENMQVVVKLTAYNVAHSRKVT